MQQSVQLVTNNTELINIGKAGRSRWMRKRPTVRGSVMNPNDHPHGGGEGKNTNWMGSASISMGQPAIGYKTRNKKAQIRPNLSRSSSY